MEYAYTHLQQVPKYQLKLLFCMCFSELRFLLAEYGVCPTTSLNTGHELAIEPMR